MALSSFTVTIITKSDSPFNVIPNAPIEIRERLANGSSGGLSLIFSDQAGLNPITQVGFAANSLGQATFFAAAADYNAVYDNNGTPVTIAVDVGVTGGILDERFDRLNPATVAAMITDTSIQVDDVLTVKKDRAGNEGGGTWNAVLLTSVTVSPGAPDVGNIVASTGNNTLAFTLLIEKKNEVTEYGKTSTKLGESINKAISDLHKPGGEETGGVVRLPKAIGNLEESIVIDNTVQTFSVDGITLEGYGRQTSRLDATALAGGQNGVNCVFPIYTNLHDFAILNSPNHGVFFDDIVSSAGNRNQIKRVQSKFAGVNGFEFARVFLTTLEGTESEFNGNNGYHWDTEVHTSWNVVNNYAKDNTAAGFHFGRMVYTHVHANASDFNQNGYLITNSRGLTFTANGAEFNERAGWLFITDATNNIRNHCSGTGNLANENNLTDSGFANHTHVTAADGIPNFVYQKQAVSLATPTANTKDFIASGRGAVLVLEDPLMLNDGPQALNDGFIQVNLTAPKLIYQKNFTATQTQKITSVTNQNGLTNDYSGEILITCSNSAFGTTGTIGTSIYKLLISKSPQGLEVVVIAKLGLVGGAASSHPSFTFTLAADEIDATAIINTAGDFWFAVEKIGGNILFV